MTWVIEDDNGSRRELDTRAEAEDVKSELEDLGATVEMRKKTSSDGGKVEVEGAEVVEMSGGDGGNENGQDDDSDTEPEPDKDDNDVVPTEAVNELPDEKPSVDTDPLSWVPGDFVDTIDGTPAINRKGFEVICQHYGVSVTTDMVESPGENGWEACIHKATAVTEDGVEYSAYGSSHIGRGDDKALLVSMSDTRAYKRAASRATGVGMLAVEELQAATVGGDVDE